MSLLAVKRRRDLRRQRWQFLAVFVTILLGVFAYATSYDAYRNLSSSYNGTYDRLAFADITVTGARDGFAEAVVALDGVSAAVHRRQVDAPFRIGDATFVGRLVGMPPDDQPAVDQVDIVDGTYLDPSRPDGVLIETHAATEFDLVVGDAFDVFDGSAWRPVEVVGVVVSPEYIWPARSRQDLFPAPGTFAVAFVDERVLDPLPPVAVHRQTLITYAEGTDAATMDDRVRSLAADYGAESVIPRAQHPSNETLQLDVEGFQQLSVLFPLLFMIAAGMAAFVLLTRLVYEQRGQIGTLRANGMRRMTLSLHYLSYGVLVGTLGAAVGTVLGMTGGWATTGVYTASLGIPDTVREFHPITPLVGMVFGVATGLVGAFVPARLVLRLAPAVAIRGDVPTADGHPSIVERVFPPARRWPIRWRMVLRGVRRSLRRSVSTILGVILGLVLILPSWGMIDTVQLLLDRQFEQVDLSDATVVFDHRVTRVDVTTIAAVDGVAAAEPVVVLDASLRSDGGDYATQLRAFVADTVVHGFDIPAGGLPARGIVVGKGIQHQTDVEVGDPVRVSFPSLGTGFETEIVALVDEPMGTFAYMRRDALVAALAASDPAVDETTLADPSISSVATRFEPGVDRDAVLGVIRSLDGVVTAIDSKALFSLIQRFMGLFWAFVGAMLFFGGAMAFALIFSTISVNVVERASEYATMRANGLSRREVARLITGENLLLTALGIVPGLIVGYGVAVWFMGQYSSDLFSFDLRMRPTTPVFAAAAMFVVAALSLWPGIRSVGEIDVAEVVRERSL